VEGSDPDDSGDYDDKKSGKKDDLNVPPTKEPGSAKPEKPDGLVEDAPENEGSESGKGA
jgi:hypothetical protein